MNAPVVRYVAAGAIAVGLVVAGLAAAHYSSSSSLRTASETLTTVSVVFDPNTQYLDPCGAVVTPPSAGPCKGAQGLLRYAFWASAVNSTLINTWRNANPGEWSRLLTHMAQPVCPNSSAPPQDMITAFGVALVSTVQAYACALGSEPITLPFPNPVPSPTRTDKKPPTAPGAMTVTNG